MTLYQLGKLAHDNAVAHGFYQAPPSIPERIALMHSELSEALEDFRDGNMQLTFDVSHDNKPIGFPTELADTIIRIVDLACYLEINLDEAVRIKMTYNERRPFRHARKVL
jgi:hypothetical protein